MHVRIVQGGQGGQKHTVKEPPKKWEQQGCEVLLDAREAQVVWMRTVQRSTTQSWVKVHNRHHKNAEKNPCSHADVACCGGVTAWDIQDVGCGKLISKEGEGVSVCCLLKSVEVCRRR